MAGRGGGILQYLQVAAVAVNFCRCRRPVIEGRAQKRRWRKHTEFEFLQAGTLIVACERKHDRILLDGLGKLCIEVQRRAQLHQLCLEFVI